MRLPVLAAVHQMAVVENEEKRVEESLARQKSEAGFRACNLDEDLSGRKRGWRVRQRRTGGMVPISGVRPNVIGDIFLVEEQTGSEDETITLRNGGQSIKRNESREAFGAENQADFGRGDSQMPLEIRSEFVKTCEEEKLSSNLVGGGEQSAIDPAAERSKLKPREQQTRKLSDNHNFKSENHETRNLVVKSSEQLSPSCCKTIKFSKQQLLLCLVCISSIGLQLTIADATGSELAAGKLWSAGSGVYSIGTEQVGRDNELWALRPSKRSFVGGATETSGATTNEGQQSGECGALTNVWRFLTAHYPTLAWHLFHWAEWQVARPAGGGLAPANSQQRKFVQLLEEADRQLQAPNETTTTQSRLQQPGWLSRVSSNPNYSRLVTHLRLKQQQQQQQNPQREAPAGRLAEWALQRQQAELANYPDDQHVSYGKVAHYPHELAASRQLAAQRNHGARPDTDLDGGPSEEGSAGLSAASPIDKLHLLRQRNRLRQQQLAAPPTGHDSATAQTNYAGSGEPPLVSGNADANILRSLTTEIEQMSPGDWRKLSESATDAARKEFVYGKVLLRPSEAIQSSSSSGGKLMERIHNERDKLLSDDRQSVQKSAPNHPNRLNFGTVVAGPTLVRSGGPTKAPSSQQLSAAASEVGHSPLARLAGDQFGFNGDSLDSEDNSGNSGLVGQQRARPFSLGRGNGGDLEEAGGERENQQSLVNEGDEFEGQFHGGPLKEIEVRQFRSEKDNETQPNTRRKPKKKLSAEENQLNRKLAQRNVFIID